MNRIKFWYKNARPVSLPQSMMPALTAAFTCAYYGDFRWYLALLSMAGVACAHLSFNLFDDYFDYKNAQQGDRSALVRMGIRAMNVKCPPLQDGTVTPRQWLKACCAFGLLACIFGFVVVLFRGFSVIWVVLAVAVLGIFYSAPPLKLGYHGLGELIIGIIFGPGIFTGMCLAGSGEMHADQVLISFAMGFMVVAILYSHSIMDYAADRKAGKKTLAWLAGCHDPETASVQRIEAGKNRQYLVLAVILFAPYALVLACLCTGLVPLYYLISFLTLPWTFSLYGSMQKFRKDPGYVPEKKWWYGSFQNWEAIKAAGIDWFMLRWLLAQRINIIFSILWIIASVIRIIAK